jgi:hypothetical protein
MSTMASNKRGLTLDQLKAISGNPSRICGELSAVILSMTDPDEETRAWAADCMEEVESIDRSKADEIFPLSQHQAEFVVYWTITMLGKSGDVSPYENQIVNILNSHPTIVVRQAAAKALAHLRTASEETMSALKEAAASTDPRLKRLAEQTLSELG